MLGLAGHIRNVLLAALLTGCTEATAPELIGVGLTYPDPSFIAEYHCSAMAETVYGTVTVSAAVSVTGNFSGGGATLKQGQSHFYLAYTFSDPSLAMPAMPSVLIYNDEVSPPKIEAATIFLTLNSGEQVLNTALPASSVPLFREQHGRRYRVQAIVRTPDFLAAFEKASALSIDVIDANRNSVLHDLRYIDHMAFSSAVERLAVRVREQMQNYKIRCEAVRPE